MGDRAADGGQFSSGRRLRCWGWSAEAPSCRGVSGHGRRVHRPLLDHPAQVHDHDFIGHLGDHAQVVGDEHDRHAATASCRIAHQVQNLRLGGHVQRRRRLIGDKSWAAGERHGDHGALAHAAAQLEGISVESLSGLGMPTGCSRSIARSRASSLLTGWCSRIASMIWLPMVCTGLKEVIGSWKIRAISPPRMARISSPAGRAWPGRSPARPGRRPAPVQKDLPSTIRPGRATMRRMDRAVTLLPQPLSPTTPSVLPRLMSKWRHRRLAPCLRPVKK